ncbi:MAG: hypothetical protein KC586_13515, partial [Myxococcales bacterium]|nr:hypothetical protein [Myxococcales bacterium]
MEITAVAVSLKKKRGLTYYSGNYDQFARQRAAARAVQAAAAKKQDARRAHLQS